MTKRMIWRAPVVLTAALALGLGAAQAAAGQDVAARQTKVTGQAAGHTASAPGWRITQVLPNLTVGGLWAGGPRDAWLGGAACADPATCGESDTSNGTVVVRHWDGTAWRPVKPPKAYINTPLDQGVGALAATSASNAWVFAYRGTAQVDHTDALHWTARGWASPVRLNGQIETAVAPGAAQMWAFGEPDSAATPGYYAHFNGKSWTRGGFPIDGTVAAAASPESVWVGGQGNGKLIIEHWNGHAWHGQTVLRPAPPLGWVIGITVLGARDVWAIVGYVNNRSSLISFLLHWNGTSWARSAVPFNGSAITPAASDGHGGLWLVVQTGTGQKQASWFAHESGGHWTKTAVPGQGSFPDQTLIDQIVAIPGTRSLWAAGEQENGDGEVIFKYSP